MSDYRLERPVADGPARFVSPLLELSGVVHGFATRQGGVSAGSFASLNFGTKGGDDPRNVAENLRRLAEAAGFAPERFYRLRQVHGAEVVEVTEQTRPSELLERPADALVTAARGATVGVVTADCVPVLFAGPGGTVGVAHAGWRGIVAGVLEATLERLGSAPAAVRVAVGPCIGVERYEVGPEVAQRFEAEPGAVSREPGHRPHLDLQAAVRARLEAAGVPRASISVPSELCTYTRADLFFSYRRHGVGTGLQLSFIGLRG